MQILSGAHDGSVCFTTIGLQCSLILACAEHHFEVEVPRGGCEDCFERVVCTVSARVHILSPCTCPSFYFAIELWIALTACGYSCLVVGFIVGVFLARPKVPYKVPSEAPSVAKSL